MEKNNTMENRYARQIAFEPIGKEGQMKLLGSRVTIIGMGALGTVVANHLCRAGVGFLRFADRDYVDLSNLQRQLLYNEEDVQQNMPKVIASYNHLSKINSKITLHPVITDVNASNIGDLISDVDLVLDATDNMETRFLINEACDARSIPWIYCGALGSQGMTMNVLPGEHPCFRCFTPKAPLPGSYPTCSTVGVLNMITNIIASVQAAEAVKILLGSANIRTSLFMMDVWNNDANYIEVKKNPDCPTCVHHQYEYLGQVKGAYATSLCGRDSVQVVPAAPVKLDFTLMEQKLQKAGNVTCNPFMLRFDNGNIEINLFQDGRAIIKNLIAETPLDELRAKSIYSEYIGL